MEYTVRPFDKKTDYDFVWQLHIKENMPYIERHMNASLETVKGWFDSNIERQQGYILIHDGRPIGCYFLLDDMDYIKLSRFFLIGDYQGCGIGRHLVPKIISEKPSGKDFIITVWKDNPVQNFWIKMGFTPGPTDEDKLMTMKYIG
jgi:predicted acetyltransferase